VVGQQPCKDKLVQFIGATNVKEGHAAGGAVG
jgi:hypothetical protein